jgi:hypothetical protein
MQSETFILQREAEFLAHGEASFRQLIADLQQHERDAAAAATTAAPSSSSRRPPPPENPNASSDEELDAEFAALHARLAAAQATKRAAQARRAALVDDTYRRHLLLKALRNRANALDAECAALVESGQAVRAEHARVTAHLQKLVQCNAVNDAFHVWYAGPFATINGFRLGTLPSRPVEWTEINAALGQAVLAIATVAARARYEFKVTTRFACSALLIPCPGPLIHVAPDLLHTKRFGLIPHGSFPKVYNVGDRRTVFTLYTDGSAFSLFPKVRRALLVHHGRSITSLDLPFLPTHALLASVQPRDDGVFALRRRAGSGEHFCVCAQYPDLHMTSTVRPLLVMVMGRQHVSRSDPTLSIPYPIDPGEGRVRGEAATLGSGEDAAWTRALKVPPYLPPYLISI